VAFNPFYPFTKELLTALTEEGNKFFVRQEFKRGKNPLHPEIKNSFLITHYKEIESAMEHYDSLNTDSYRFLYDIDNPEHLNKLEIAASNPEGYSVFANVFHTDWQKRIGDQLMNRIRYYIGSKLKWKPERNDNLKFNLFMDMGTLSVKIMLNGKEAIAKFGEIEKPF
jgi:hypothetical protein